MAGNNSETPQIAPSYLPNVPAHISNFSDRAFRSARSSLFKFTAQTNQYSEQATEGVRQAIRPFYQSGSAYRLGAVADATNISFSFCALYYLFEHAYQQTSNVLTPREFKLALNEFHEAEKDPGGLALAVVFTVFLITISTLGSTYDEKRDPKWVKYFDFWTSLRDALKQIKWSTKGLWAALILSIKYNLAAKDVLLHVFFPLAIISSTIAVLNRIFLRWIRDSRKDLVKSNLDLIDNIRSPLRQLDKLPKSFEGYEYSLLVLKDTKEVYYVTADAKPERIAMVGLSDFSPDDITSLVSCLTDPDLREIKDRITECGDEYKEINFTSEHIKKIEHALHGLADSDLAEKLLAKWDVKWGAFSQEIEALRTKNIHARMKQHLNHMLKNNSDVRLHFVADKHDANLVEEDDKVLRTRDSRLHGAYVYFSQEEGIKNNQRLYYVDDTGKLTLQPGSSKFHREYLDTLRDPNVLSITAEQLITLTHPDIQSKTLGQDYAAFVAFREKILKDQKIRDQDELVLFGGRVRLPTKYFAPLSAGLSAMSDGAYYYIYATAMAMTVLSPFWALIMLGSAALLFTFLFITRISEELDFERRLSVTIDRAQVELSKKSCVFLREKLVNLAEREESGDSMSESELHALIRDVEASKLARHEQLKQFATPESNHTSENISENISDEKMKLYEKAFTLLWNELRDELTLSKKLQDQLRVKLNRSYLAAGLEGIQHGMSVQGAIASCMFMVSTFCTSCPPMFILGCMLAGLTVVALSCLQGLFNHYLYLRKVARTTKALSLEFEENLVKATSVTLIQAADRETIEKNMNYINNNSLEAPTDSMMMEWSELFRVFFLGLVKGNKAFVELFARLLESCHSPVWVLNCVLGCGAVSFGTALLGRAAAKGFAIGRPDSKTDAGNSKAKAYGFWDGRNTLKKSDGVFSSAYLPESASDSDEDDVRSTPGMSLLGSTTLL